MYQETDSIVVFITVNGIIISTKQPSVERYLTCKHFFDSIVVNFGKILAAHQRNILKIFKSSQKKHPWRSLILVKLQEVEDKTSEVFCEKGVLRKVLKTTASEALF